MNPLVFLFLFFPLFTFGQRFIKIADTSNTWTIISHYRTSNDMWSTYKLRLEKESLRDTQGYFKIIKTTMSKEEMNETFIGFIREDENGNVFFSEDKEKEVLIYSFDVCVGDTITVCNPLSYYFEQQILIVDSIYIVLINEIESRKIVLKPTCPIQRSTIWIEGIGDLKGLLNNTIPDIICTSDSIIGFATGIRNEKLSCFEKENIIIYHNPVFEQCIKTNSE